MSIDFSNAELLFLYGRLKRELTAIKSAKTVKVPKSEIELYESMLLKMESENPALKNLPF
ncbi:hypothetical protein [Lacrimispora sp.]|uniref:hypothetical protein n=1 Tax=Lacrimispora sp. TaxID=2719234 RepID=UPI00345FBAF6